MIIRQAM